MRTTLTMLIAAALLCACGGGDDGTESAGDAVRRQFGFLSKGQYGREWDELHPGQQALITRAHFETCAANAGIGEITDVRVVETYDDPIDLPAVPEKTSKAVTVEYRHNGRKSTETFHEVLVEGKWRWVVREPEEYANGECPS